MKLDSQTIAEAAQRIGIKPEELAAVIQRGAAVTYQAGDYLFHDPHRASGSGSCWKGRLISCVVSTATRCCWGWRNRVPS